MRAFIESENSDVPNSRHFVSYKLLEGETWIKNDDGRVERAEIGDLYQSNTYLAFYCQENSDNEAIATNALTYEDFKDTVYTRIRMCSLDQQSERPFPFTVMSTGESSDDNAPKNDDTHSLSNLLAAHTGEHVNIVDFLRSQTEPQPSTSRTIRKSSTTTNVQESVVEIGHGDQVETEQVNIEKKVSSTQMKSSTLPFKKRTFTADNGDRDNYSSLNNRFKLKQLRVKLTDVMKGKPTSSDVRITVTKGTPFCKHTCIVNKSISIINCLMCYVTRSSVIIFFAVNQI